MDSRSIEIRIFFNDCYKDPLRIYGTWKSDMSVPAELVRSSIHQALTNLLDGISNEGLLELYNQKGE